MRRASLRTAHRIRLNICVSEKGQMVYGEDGSLLSRLALTSGHSVSMMLNTTESRTRPLGRMRCLRRTPSCCSPQTQNRRARLNVKNVGNQFNPDTLPRFECVREQQQLGFCVYVCALSALTQPGIA